jgi:hypothetical protein
MNKKRIAIAALLLLTGVVVYNANTQDKTVITAIDPGTAEVLTVAEPIVVEISPPVVITGKLPAFRHGTKLCQWYEDAGMRAVKDIDGTSESICAGDTCFLLVHDAGMPAGWIMAAWLSEARSGGHDPRKETVELSVFTFQDGNETDHVIYFPHLDVFEQR